MRTLTIMEHISLDGVIQHSDDGDGFPYGDWTGPYRSAEGLDAVLAAQGERFDLLLGRRTYDEWSRYWPSAPSSPMADRLDAATKLVATHRPDTLAWGPARAIGPDLAADVRRLKSESGPDLVLWGSSTVASALLDRGLADRIVLITYPVVLGAGKRLFADGIGARSLELSDRAQTPSGVIVATYAVRDRLHGGAAPG